MRKCSSTILYAACTFRPYKSTPVLKLFRTFTERMTKGLSLRMVFSLLFQDTLLIIFISSIFFASRAVIVTLSLLADVLLATLYPLASHWRRTLDWRRSTRRPALSSASAPISTPQRHMPTFFAAAVIQSRPSSTTTLNTTHLRLLPLRGIAPRVSRFFCRQSP